jgi:hypothetical protein
MSRGSKRLRMEGYDIARQRMRGYLGRMALALRHNGEDDKARLAEVAAEYIGMMMADYKGEPAAKNPQGGK